MANLLPRFSGSVIGGRGFSAAAAAVGQSLKEKAVVKEQTSSSSPLPAKNSWVPDPVSGDYRPTNSGRDADNAVEMRDKLLPESSHD